MRAQGMLVIVVVLAGCVSLPPRQAIRGGGVPGSAPPATGRSVFSAELSAPTGASEVPAASGSLELLFRDQERFEYRLILRDAPDITYTMAWIVRRGTSVPAAVVASDVELRGVYVQLRGTGTLPDQAQGATLLEGLRRAPGDFEVWLAASPGGSVVLRGVIR